MPNKRRKSKVIKATAKYNRSQLPDWLNALNDTQLDKYFMEHPTSKYNPFTNGVDDDEDEDDDTGGDTGGGDTGGGDNGGDDPPDPNDDDWTEHKLPLARRLTFNGWSKSAPTKDVKAKREKYAEALEDLSLDRLDIQDVLEDLVEEQRDDKEARADITSPRRKKRYDKRIDRRANKISKLRQRKSKLGEKTTNLKKKVRRLDKELKSRV